MGRSQTRLFTIVPLLKGVDSYIFKKVYNLEKIKKQPIEQGHMMEFLISLLIGDREQ